MSMFCVLLIFLIRQYLMSYTKFNMNLLKELFIQLINRKLLKMRELHDEDAVVLRRNKKHSAQKSGLGDNNGNLGGGGRRLSWSISDLSRLPTVKTNTLVKTRCSRVRNTSISSCSLSSGNYYTSLNIMYVYNI